MPRCICTARMYCCCKCSCSTVVSMSYDALKGRRCVCCSRLPPFLPSSLRRLAGVWCMAPHPVSPTCTAATATYDVRNCLWLMCVIFRRLGEVNSAHGNFLAKNKNRGKKNELKKTGKNKIVLLQRSKEQPRLLKCCILSYFNLLYSCPGSF
jgi:hypothetical protein